MHMLVFVCVCLNNVKYLLNKKLLCIFCARKGETTVKNNSSIVAVLSMVLSELNNGLFNELVLSIWPVEKPQFLD